MYLELGAEYYDAGAINQFSFGQIMLRYWLVQNVELRVLLNSYIVQNDPVVMKPGLRTQVWVRRLHYIRIPISLLLYRD